jgi:hypothetical protein
MIPASLLRLTVRTAAAALALTAVVACSDDEVAQTQVQVRTESVVVSKDERVLTVNLRVAHPCPTIQLIANESYDVVDVTVMRTTAFQETRGKTSPPAPCEISEDVTLSAPLGIRPVYNGSTRYEIDTYYAADVIAASYLPNGLRCEAPRVNEGFDRSWVRECWGETDPGNLEVLQWPRGDGPASEASSSASPSSTTRVRGIAARWSGDRGDRHLDWSEGAFDIRVVADEGNDAEIVKVASGLNVPN